MNLLQPTNAECFFLKLPNRVPTSQNGPTTIDDAMQRKLGLEYRTGAAVTVVRSNIYVHGGLTIPLNLNQVNTLKLQKELILYFAKQRNKDGISFQNLNQYISSELFFLDLISRTWKHIPTTTDIDSTQTTVLENDLESNTDSTMTTSTDHYPLLCPLKERLYHSICFFDSALYMFGGLIVSPQNGYELIATNELWKLDLKGSQPFKWTLISDDPRIARRFNHTMHVKNEYSDIRDPKLIIVGGLNNLNEPIDTIDVYNLTKNCWQSDVIPPKPLTVKTNINSFPINLTNDRNFSILIENNEAKIPSLVFFTPNCQNTTDSSIKEIKRDDISDDNDNVNIVNVRDKIDKIISPITTLPLISNSEGVRIAYNGFQKNEYLVEPFNLKSPTGDNYGDSIVMCGFYPDRKASSLKCYIFGLISGRWTRISTKCPDSQHTEHRFWRVFVWKSHHQAFLLGTKKNDGYLPSVQRFDCILTFDLSMVNAFNNIYPSLIEAQLLTSGNDTVNSTALDNLNNIFKQNLIIDNEQNTQNFKDGQRNDSMNSTSPFEKYIRYIAPSVELNNVKSIFPSYAMVLGKDSLEIFGKSLSDFEFITSEGDTIGVPLYLLRKRWGRYFDLLLAKSYSNVISDYEQSGIQSTLIKNASKSSRAGSTDLDSKRRWSSISSLSHLLSRPDIENSTGGINNALPYKSPAIFGKNDNNSLPNTTVGRSDSIDEDKELLSDITASHNNSIMAQKTHILQSDSSRRPSAVSFKIDDRDESIPPHAIPSNISNDITDNDKSNHKNNQDVMQAHTSPSTTSSSGGLVFRIPFKEKAVTSSSSPSIKDPSPDKLNDPKSDKKRRSSLMGLSTIDKNKITYSSNSDLYHRRASHPTIIRKSDISTTQNLHHPSARNGSSTRSSISFVSSSSDRMGKSRNNSRANSIHELQIPGILSVVLPPQMEAPNEPLPTPSISSNHTSLYDYEMSSKGSPLSSRRPSYIKNYSIPDMKSSTDTIQNSLDKQLLENSSESHFQETSLSKEKIHDSLPNVNSATFYGQLGNNFVTNGTSRPSIASNTDSINSHISMLSFELEPLMIPRSLYMPWPTPTIRAFSEFFYTGQVSSKWLFAPVVLDLLVMSKIYEIPLLYSLVSEVLYFLIGKKEESIYLTCKTTIKSLKNRVEEHFGGNKDKITNYLNNCSYYRDLIRIKESLETSQEGFIETDTLTRTSRTYSENSRGSSSDGDEIDRIASWKSEMTGQLANFFRSIHEPSPRASLSSLASTGVPSSVPFEPRKSATLLSPMVRKKSSLSKEIGVSGSDEDQNYSSGDDLLYTSPKIVFKKPGNKLESSNNDRDPESKRRKGSIPHIDPLDILTSDDTSSSSSSSSSDASIDNDDNFNHEREEKLTDKSMLENFNKSDTMVSERSTEHSSRTSLRDARYLRDIRDDPLATLESNVGILSLKKMKKMVKKGEEYLDDSVDPLMKINSTLQSPPKSQRSYNRTSPGSSFVGLSSAKLHKDNLNAKDWNTLTLENMLATNSPPPVDYIIKSIYRTTVLVNDSRLIIKCLDCLELSKTLRKCKKGIKSLDIN